MPSVRTDYITGNQHAREALAQDEFEQAQQLCDYPCEDTEDEEDTQD